MTNDTWGQQVPGQREEPHGEVPELRIRLGLLLGGARGSSSALQTGVSLDLDRSWGQDPICEAISDLGYGYRCHMAFKL
jgi:hypothetical protein